MERDLHFICDLGSQNGTFRKSRRLKTDFMYEVFDGVHLGLADLEVVYVVASSQVLHPQGGKFFQ